MKIARNIRWRH